MGVVFCTADRDEFHVSFLGGHLDAAIAREAIALAGAYDGSPPADMAFIRLASGREAGRAT